jgi:aspartyl protease/PDZ domain-containing protein
MICRALIASIFIIASGVAAIPQAILPASNQAAKPAEIVIPFELINKHILMKIRVNNSEPLWFIFDTGDKLAIIDMERAKALGLNLQGEINVGGAGVGSLKGAFVKESSYTVPGLEGFTQPVALALPLNMLNSRFGQNVDGIIGSDFIKQFVVEVDYTARQIRLRDKEKFVYTGPGEAIPIRLNSQGHPIIEGEVTVEGRDPIKGSFVIDLGSGGALALHRPFVEEHRLPLPNQKTIRLMGAGGAGGEVTGRVGRVAALRFGKFIIDNPVTLFAADAKGAFANNVFQGNIGEQIMEKFKIILDYSRDRIILEPNARFKAPVGAASSGLNIVSEGADYKTFRIKETLENAPGAEAGLQKDDLIIAVDGQPASQLTLAKLIEMFEREAAYKLTIRRGEQTLQVTMTPRRLV